MITNVAVLRWIRSWTGSLVLFFIATLGEFAGLVGWYALDHAGHAVRAALILLAGFVVERWVVVLWLNVPWRVITPSGNMRPLLTVLAGVTIAEIAAWVLWIRLVEAGEPAFAAAVLIAGIHAVHSYEVALLKHRTVQAVLKDGGVIALTALESLGALIALYFVVGGQPGHGALAMFLALLSEHVLQVSALKKDKEADARVPQTAPA